MLSLPSEEAVLAKLLAFAEPDQRIRAMVLTSSRTRPDGPVDLLSDYDVILAVADQPGFVGEGDWVSGYGEPMVRWGDEGQQLDIKTTFRGVVYQDGIKVDWSIWPIELPKKIGQREALPDQLDVGYRILLDKDELTSSWKPPSHKAHIPRKPTEAEYHALVEEFWWGATYVAKGLWRDDLIIAKYCLDQDMKQCTLIPFLEWMIEIERGWTVKPGVLGRHLKKLLRPEIWAALEATYVGSGIDENWEAMWRTCGLFRLVAQEVGDQFGFPYPGEVDRRVTEYVRSIQG